MGAAYEVYNALGFGMAEAQLFNYMRIARKQVCYLINFGQKGELDWKRFVLSDLHPSGGNERLEHSSSLIEH